MQTGLGQKLGTARLFPKPQQTDRNLRRIFGKPPVFRAIEVADGETILLFGPPNRLEHMAKSGRFEAALPGFRHFSFE
ncbi:hypothetical protein VK792_07680 [Mesobacterium sp. TK19101]|uniref:Uncharacterized protein n=1 Tax=Mesobacterium hydrothermale TaxID=3111907 RepID=A0ABU6HH43_9RHOB|nr:hypothetical protein [Mesobacterium sp. TK19101]MEC3861160.1 hypothetical protein [Mesobacterium sp. TK19101]